jgi:V-type H+-transporting ATPase subunit G
LYKRLVNVSLYIGRANGLDRVQRLKDARAEAAKEIDAIKAQKQAEFAASQQNDVGSVDASVAKVTQETEQDLVKITQEYASHKAAVIKKLLDQVTTVEPKMHPNALNPHTAW